MSKLSDNRKVSVRRTNDGEYKIEQLTNTGRLLVGPTKFFRVDDFLTETELDTLCREGNYTVTINAMRD